MRRSIFRELHTNEKGSYLVFVSFFFLLFLMFAAFAIDKSRLNRLEQRLQSVADRAAIAAAQDLPDTALARRNAIRYIRQEASDYKPSFDDIQIEVTDDSSSGTVGIVVHGYWNAMFIPTSIADRNPKHFVKTAIAVMQMSWAGDSLPGTLGDWPDGPFAIVAGETDPTVNSTITGNGIEIIGGAHFNHGVTVTGNLAQAPDVYGNFEATSLTNTVDQHTGSTVVPADNVERPTIDPTRLNYDALLDPTDAAQFAYYSGGPVAIVLDVGADGLYGTGDDVTLKDNTGADVKAEVDGGFRWTLYGQNATVDNTNNPGIGNGVDLQFKGDLDVGDNGAGFTWTGSLTATAQGATKGKITFNYNNSEIRAVLKSDAVEGKDNPSLAIHSGFGTDWDELTFDNGGNALNIYGVLYCQGSMLWTGNMSDPNSSDPGSEGAYDATGNGFVKGAIIVGDLDSSGGGGGGLTGNNIKIWYDGTLAGDLPTNEKVTARMPSKHRVILLQ